jgi:hypothetical protein
VPIPGAGGNGGTSPNALHRIRTEGFLRPFGPVVICQTVRVTPESWTSNGHPLALDPETISTDPELPAFLKPPEGAPAYYGFPLLSGIEYDEFKLGMITDFIRESDAVEGDLYIVAPDGSRAGIIWCTGPIKRYQENEPPNPVGGESGS